jgi:glutamine phosphoribosylpyrophosphate amidotransferase
MCGIVGAVAQRDIAEILLEGLRRLEYRGYDSAGLAVVDNEGHMTRVRRLGKVQMLAQAVEEHPLHGGTGLPIPAGRRTVNRLKVTRIRMFLNTLWWCITALSKTTSRCAKC